MAPSISEVVYEELYADIRTGVLVPGTPLREDVLTRKHGVSRTPVREALQRLLHDGLVERPAQRFTVRRLTADQVSEVYPIIAVLEGLGSRLAAVRITDDELTQLVKLHETIIDAAARDDQEMIQESNVKLHAIVLHAGGNEALIREVNRFRAITEHFRSIVLKLPHRPTQSISDHQELIDALQARDGHRAETVMRAHVMSAYQLLLSVIEAGRYLEQPRVLLMPDSSSADVIEAPNHS